MRAPFLLATGMGLVCAGGCGLLVGYDDYAGSSSGTGGSGSGGSGDGGGGGTGPSCSDEQQNGAETDEDCGGDMCDRCAVDQGCEETSDCRPELVCDEAKLCCAPVTCESATCPPENDGCGQPIDCSGEKYFCESNNACSPEGECTCDGLGCTLVAMRLGYASALAIAVDGEGNVIVVGRFRRTMTIPSLEAISTMNPSKDSDQDIFVVKFDRGGKGLWAKRFGDEFASDGPGNQGAQGIAVDASNNIYVTGYAGGTVDSQTIDFGKEFHSTKTGSNSSFVLKLSPSGDTEWVSVHGFGDTSVDASAIAVTDEGRAFITGTYTGTPSLGSGGKLPSPGAATRAVFLASYDEDGKPLFSRGFGKGGHESSGIAVKASSDAVYLAGNFQKGTLDFGDGWKAANNDASKNDFFVAKMDLEDGATKWAKFFGTEGIYDTASGMFVDAEGAAFVTGFYGGAPTYAGEVPLLATGTGFNAFVLKVGADGKPLLAKGFGASSSQVLQGYGIAPLGSSGAVIIGDYSGTSQFADGKGLPILPVPSIYVAALDADLDVVWAKGYSPATPVTVTTGDQGVFVTGLFSSDPLSFGGDDLYLESEIDTFLVKLSP